MLPNKWLCSSPRIKMEIKQIKKSPYSHCSPVFDLFARISSYNPIPFPLHWDTELGRFTDAYFFSWKYLPWFLCIYGPIGGTFVAAMHCISNAKEVGFALTIMSICWGGFALVVCIAAMVFVVHWSTVVRGFECYNQLTYQLDTQCPAHAQSFINNKSWKRISLILCSISGILGILPPILSIPVVITNMDSHQYSLPVLLCGGYTACSEEMSWVVIALRSVVTYVAISEACRFLFVFWILALFLVERQMHCFHILSKMAKSPDAEYGLGFFRWYSILQTADRQCNESFATIIANALGGWFMIWIAVNIFMIKCVTTLPLTVYWMMPIASIIIFVFSGFTLTFIVNSRVAGESELFAIKLFLEEHQRTPESKRMKFNKKLVLTKLAHCKGIILRCGQFFHVKEENKITYFNDVFTRTIDGIMLDMFE